MTGFYLSVVHVDAVTQCLEGVEADAYGQEYVQCDAIRMQSYDVQYVPEIVGKEVVVFRYGEDAEVEEYVQCADGFTESPVVCVVADEQPADVTADGGQCYE